ncbi:MAG: hypothetical protein M8843_02475 [marine benthic group bacterium]|nr:hypothetical protein [Gemmatimonadota bacterium]MCL7976302.1 hypothetical protein [Gemmatimonadota bacterium]
MNAEQEGRLLVIPEAIRSLLDQRAQYMEWLSRLDDLGGQYRHEVASRVRADYKDRLVGVENELQGHQAELESSLAERQGRLAELEQRHDVCAAELEEVELRHQVGEFDDEEWERRKAEYGEELESVGDELELEREAVAELGTVLVQVTAPAEAAATKHVEPGAWSEPASEVVLAEEDEAREEVLEEVLEEEESGAEARDPGPAVEESVEAPSEGHVVEEESAEESGGDEFLDELEFLESLSLDDPESFDAVSKMLEEEGEGSGESEESTDRGGAG